MSKDMVLLVAPDIRVVVSEKLKPGQMFLCDANTIVETDFKTGDVRYPLKGATKCA
ncbi:MAG: hypothetical protein NUW01_02930 [Gemmatimonadaceae bacterium]|nr:hypothetical protein [Gemmatimonadaceae bacterium]